MWNITKKNVAANKIRLALTALAIVLGVGFISAANILSDGLQDSFGDLAAEITQGTDLQVSPDADVALTSAEVEAISTIDGVRVAEGQHSADDNTVLPIRPDGTVVQPSGPPVIAFSWTTDGQLNPTTIETGRSPEGPGEWVLDMDSAADNGFVVGETYDLVVPTQEGRTTAELVGTFRFGAENQTNGAVLIAFETEEAEVLFDRVNFSDVAIATDGSRDIVNVRVDVEGIMGPDYVTLDTADLNAEQSAEFNSFISIFAWVLRAFAIVALFVSVFIIANTFNIVMSQRVRELGLLRAIGATPKQVQRAVLGEAFVVGLAASSVGLGIGLGLAYGLEAALNAIGAGLPDFDKPLSIATIVIGLGVGIGVTMLSAWVPARKAGRTAPVTAISGNDGSDLAGGRRSLLIGAVLALAGAGFTGFALFGGIDSTATLLGMLGGGAALLFIGITLLSPLVAAPISRTLGAPISKIYRKPGSLAKENAARNPKRTATTAAALMIGLSLVSMAFVVGQTLKNDLNALLETTVQADYAAFPSSDAGLVPEAVAGEMESAEHLTNITPIKNWGTVVNGEDSDVSTLPLDQLDASFDLGLVDGSYADLNDDTMAMRENLSDTLGLGVGDSAAVELADGSTKDLEIVALFSDGTIFEGILVTDARWNTIGDQDNFDWIAASIVEGSTTEQAAADMDAIRAAFPQLVAQSTGEYQESISAQVDQLLYILTGFLGLAILIAFIGIINTMALSIFERTRELGLLRAVGMTRSQMHRMVRWEAAIVSGVGALLGAAVGVVFGVLVVIATPDEILNRLALPWLQLALLVAVAIGVGLVAGFMPARRAGKLNVLDAISH
jgi:putative ABC transport system permease protein